MDRPVTIAAPLPEARRVTIRRWRMPGVGLVMVYIFLGLFAAAGVFPVWNVLARSLSAEAYVRAGLVSLVPIGFNIQGYRGLLTGGAVLSGLWNSVYVTAISLPIQMFMTTTAAYALSRPRLPGRGVLMWLFIIPMLFGPGLIPSYLLVRELGMIDTHWALIIPNSMSVFYMIVMRSYFMTIPVDLEDAAMMDGADHFQVFVRVFLPLSVPALASISLFYFVGDWNIFFAAVIYIRDGRLQVLQTILRDIIFSAQYLVEAARPEDYEKYASIEAMKSAAVILTSLPIFVVYPFLQRYFEKGLTLGALKG